MLLITHWLNEPAVVVADIVHYLCQYAPQNTQFGGRHLLSDFGQIFLETLAAFELESRLSEAPFWN